MPWPASVETTCFTGVFGSLSRISRTAADLLTSEFCLAMFGLLTKVEGVALMVWIGGGFCYGMPGNLPPVRTIIEGQTNMNRHPKRTFLSSVHAMVAVVLAATAFVTPGQAVTLAEKGQARAVLILPEKPSPVAE